MKFWVPPGCRGQVCPVPIGLSCLTEVKIRYVRGRSIEIEKSIKKQSKILYYDTIEQIQ